MLKEMEEIDDVEGEQEEENVREKLRKRIWEKERSKTGKSCWETKNKIRGE